MESPSLLPAPLGDPIGKAAYSNLPTLKAALQEYAAGNGYAICVESSSDRRAFYRCSKGSKYNAKCKDNLVYLLR